MIIILVEGSGDRRSIPSLLQRGQLTFPIRCIDMKGKSNILREHHGFEDTVRRQHALGGKGVRCADRRRCHVCTLPYVG